MFHASAWKSFSDVLRFSICVSCFCRVCCGKMRLLALRSAEVCVRTRETAILSEIRQTAFQNLTWAKAATVQIIEFIFSDVLCLNLYCIKECYYGMFAVSWLGWFLWGAADDWLVSTGSLFFSESLLVGWFGLLGKSCLNMQSSGIERNVSLPFLPPDVSVKLEW